MYYSSPTIVLIKKNADIRKIKGFLVLYFLKLLMCGV